MKYWWMTGAAIAVVVITIAITASKPAASSFDETKTRSDARMVGHRLLLAGGDKHSRVMPVEIKDDGSLLLRFEKPFAPVADSLYLIAATQFYDQMPVSVLVRSKTSGEAVYSFLAFKNQPDSTIPCLDRPLPLDDYELLISFPPNSNHNYFLLTAILLMSAGLGAAWYWRKRKANANVNLGDNQSVFKLGNFLYHPAQYMLKLNDKEILLTGKENELLHLLAMQPNTIMERSVLQKKIWEDQGVVVGRSLDIFISRLRKKLQADASVKIEGIHGVGYRLEVS